MNVTFRDFVDLSRNFNKSIVRPTAAANPKAHDQVLATIEDSLALYASADLLVGKGQLSHSQFVA